MRAVAAGLAACFAVAGPALAQTYEANGDIWKYRVPKERVRAEFDGEDVMGIIVGKHIATDCSVNVVKGGKIYCFTAAASQTFFKYAPDTNLAKAREVWDRMKSDGAEAIPSQ